MWTTNGVLFLFIVAISKQTDAVPFLRNTVQSLSTSIASGSSPDNGNISDLRKRNRAAKIKQLSKYQNEDGDDFKDGAAGSADQNEALPGIIQKKVAKILRKLRLISQLANSFRPVDDDGEKDPDFDVDFDSEEVNNGTMSRRSELAEDDEKRETLSEQASNDDRRFVLSPSGVGVYFMELVGSLVGLVYGAALQLGNNNSKPNV